jgi:hypothetical protein
LSEGSQDYDLVGYTKEQIINDIEYGTCSSCTGALTLPAPASTGRLNRAVPRADAQLHLPAQILMRNVKCAFSWPPGPRDAFKHRGGTGHGELYASAHADFGETATPT